MLFHFRAASALLAGSALIAIASPLHAQESEPEAGQSDQTEALEDEDNAIVVTGTRIRGARVIGDATTFDREAIVEAGLVDLGEAVRVLPQNFSGGQNPGVGSGAGLINQNVNSASSANLRGLGPDATLTLLNGHRLPYNAAFQAVDISAIPLAAVDRIEVVPDGASALYGSDAVGGVVNVILRRDFEGLTTSAQIGASTDGGNFRQQFDIVGGTTWDNGGAILAYDFANNSAIEARQRDYASSLIDETTLYPEIQRHAVTLSAHHDISPGIEASVDAVYSNRNSRRVTGSETLQTRRAPEVEGFAIAPTLRFDIGGGWQARIEGVYGRDRTLLDATFTPADGSATTSDGRFLNELVSLEAGIDGPLFALPGGEARLALGGGIRNNRLDYALDDGFFDAAFDVEREARFGYAELYLPFVSSANEISGISQLTLSAAVRYEDYSDLDEQATPRIGVIYAPIDGFSLRGSWSRSFKAPTLFQQFTFYEAILLPAAPFGAGSGNDTILFTAGGSPDVGPERAQSWTAGFEIQPDAIAGLTVSATWFDIDYTDRVVSPVSGGLASAISNPGFASLIDFSPEADTLDALIAGAQFGLENFTASPYDPANVAVLIDNRNRNVAAWQVEGIDARVAWSGDVGTDSSIGFGLSASWLDSQQQVTSDLPEVQLAGTLFNPPEFRMRGTARFATGSFTANAAVNYIGALSDDRFGPEQRLSPTATVDLGLRYDLIQGVGREPGLEVSLTVQNLFNDEPDPIGQRGPTDTPYDSTNYSPIGRFVAIGLRRHW